MAGGRITKASVSALVPPSQGRSFLWDNKLAGFGIFITPSGCRTYVLQYRMGGRGYPTRRYTIGRHGSPWTPETARKRAIDLLTEVRRGLDPLQVEQASKKLSQADERLKVDVYVETFLDKHVAKKKLRSAPEIRNTLERNFVPYFSGRSIDTIKEKEILNHVDAFGERSPSSALKLFRHLRSFFNFAQKRDDIASSPMRGLEEPEGYASRNRALVDWELQRVWEAAHDLGGAAGTIIKFLLLTAQREFEVAGATWSEFDLKNRNWIIPKERTKNKREHLVPLSDPVLKLLGTEWRESERSGLLFPNSKGKLFTGFPNCKASFDLNVSRRVQLALELGFTSHREIAPFTFHDLRRSVATGLQRLGVPIAHTEAVLNHVSGSKSSLVGVYQVYDYEQEKRDALDLWGEHMHALWSSKEAWPGGGALPKLRSPTRKKPTRGTSSARCEPGIHEEPPFASHQRA